MRQRFSLQSLVRLFASNTFFWLVIGLFVFQAAWIALTGRYPQAFDEQFHFGAIQLHAQRLWWPFLPDSVMGSNGLGQIARDTSFLYHYLMAFPYRLLTVITDSVTAQIIGLRLVDVALAASGFVIYRKVCRSAGLSAAKTNAIIFFVALLPVFPLMAGQLNYDDLLFPLTGLTFLWAIRLYQGYRAQGALDWLLLLRLILLMLFVITVKYPFLPIALALVVFFAPIVWRQRRVMRSEVWRAVVRLRHRSQVLYAVAAIIGLLLVGGSYGVNVWRYHKINPSCNQVLSVQECSSYGPWLRDYLNEHDPSRVKPSVAQIVGYPVVWAESMMRETFFTIYSKYDANHVVLYFVGEPIRPLIDMGWVWFWLGVAVLAGALPYLLRDGLTRMLLLATLLYTAALFLVNVRDFIDTSQPVAIHGRYFFPVLIPWLICLVGGFDHILLYMRPHYARKLRHAALGLLLLSAVVYTQGSGFGTYVVRSNDDWFWPQSTLAQRVNAGARRVIDPVVLD